MLICQLSDLHVRPVGLAANRVSETNMLTERAFRLVAAFNPQPEVVMITGDLTECGLPAEVRKCGCHAASHLADACVCCPGQSRPAG